jgi:hypothetical protein
VPPTDTPDLAELDEEGDDAQERGDGGQRVVVISMI